MLDVCLGGQKREDARHPSGSAFNAGAYARHDFGGRAFGKLVALGGGNPLAPQVAGVFHPFRLARLKRRNPDPNDILDAPGVAGGDEGLGGTRYVLGQVNGSGWFRQWASPRITENYASESATE